MTVYSTLDRNATSVATRTNIITGGQSTCTYSELPSLLNHIDRFLAGYRITSSDTLSVECTNSLSGALLLLALLRAEYSFALAPPAAAGIEIKPTPNFCSHRLTVFSEHGGEPFAPERFLRVEPNAHYNGRPGGQAKLYLRTSGSMGVSKIVVHSHGKLLGNAGNVVRKYGFNCESRAAIPVPIAHMYGSAPSFCPQS